MHHKVTAKIGPVEHLPCRAQCSCGTGGDFGSSYDAQVYFDAHRRGLGGISTFEFVDEFTPTPVTETPQEADA